MAMSTVDLGVPNGWMELPILYGVKSFRLEKKGLGGYDMRQ